MFKCVSVCVCFPSFIYLCVAEVGLVLEEGLEGAAHLGQQRLRLVCVCLCVCVCTYVRPKRTKPTARAAPGRRPAARRAWPAGLQPCRPASRPYPSVSWCGRCRCCCSCWWRRQQRRAVCEIEKGENVCEGSGEDRVTHTHSLKKKHPPTHTHTLNTHTHTYTHIL